MGNKSEIIGIPTQAKYAKFLAEVSDIKEQVQIKVLEEDSRYSGTINDFLGIKSNYNDKLIIQEGQLVYVSSAVSNKEEEWLEQLGVPKAND